ncbi:MAG: hypothetical protein WBW33_31730 [Bryobacteraceae bacterium]
MKTLLMGGQACVLYGAAEFSRDLDLLILVDDDSLSRLRTALTDLKAEPIAVPALDAMYLERGHAVHFRCWREDVAGVRIDLMSSLRGVDPFDDLWERRTTIEVAGESVELLALKDLVAAKKTQRDKDWPMIRRLVEQDYFASEERPASERSEFWLRELRTPELLMEATSANPEAARRIGQDRPAVQAALRKNLPDVARALEQEELEERRKDRSYWEPLKRELEEFRRQRRESQ